MYAKCVHLKPSVSLALSYTLNNTSFHLSYNQIIYMHYHLSLRVQVSLGYECITNVEILNEIIYTETHTNYCNNYSINLFLISTHVVHYFHYCQQSVIIVCCHSQRKTQPSNVLFTRNMRVQNDHRTIEITPRRAYHVIIVQFR